MLNIYWPTFDLIRRTLMLYHAKTMTGTCQHIVMIATLMEAGAIPGSVTSGRQNILKRIKTYWKRNKREQKGTTGTGNGNITSHYTCTAKVGKSREIITKTNKVLTNSNSWSITKHNTWFGKVTKNDRTLPTTIKFEVMAIAGVLRQGHS